MVGFDITAVEFLEKYQGANWKRRGLYLLSARLTSKEWKKLPEDIAKQVLRKIWEAKK